MFSRCLFQGDCSLRIWAHLHRLTVRVRCRGGGNYSSWVVWTSQTLAISASEAKWKLLSLWNVGWQDVSLAWLIETQILSAASRTEQSSLGDPWQVTHWHDYFDTPLNYHDLLGFAKGTAVRTGADPSSRIFKDGSHWYIWESRDRQLEKVSFDQVLCNKSKHVETLCPASPGRHPHSIRSSRDSRRKKESGNGAFDFQTDEIFLWWALENPWRGVPRKQGLPEMQLRASSWARWQRHQPREDDPDKGSPRHGWECRSLLLNCFLGNKRKEECRPRKGWISPNNPPSASYN